MTPDEQLRFFDRIWGEATGYVQFQQKQKDADGNRTGDPTDTKFFLWPSERARIGRYLSLRTEEDLYFAVPIYSTTQRRETEAKWITAIYADDDGVTGQYRRTPDITVESSPGHRHQYWVLPQPANPKEVKRLAFELSAAHRHDNEFHGDMAEHKFCGTDPGGWDHTQILRVPGTLNRKAEYGPGFQHRVSVEDRGTTTTVEELGAVYPVTTANFVVALPDDILPDDIPDHVALLGRLSNRADLIDLFTNEPTGRGNAQGWDERLFAFENELFRLGFTPQEVYSLAWFSACNKFKRGVRNENGGYSPRPNPTLDLWRDVLKASMTYADVENTWQAPEYDRESTFELVDAPTPAQRALASVTKRVQVELLTVAEAESIAGKRTFIDRYVEWASSKTDAAIPYHVASAFTILSVIFGEFGHAMPKFGKLGLNMWFLVLGRTTRSRKSTSRGLMMKVIDGITTSDYEYDEGGDFTSEALLERLSEKPHQSSLVHRDEVQGLFAQINSKNYMSGLNDTLTELYDGKVRKVLRKGVRTEGGETNFVLFLMGIVSKVTSVLTLEDFQSGFLARFIHVIGESPERTRESEWLDQASPNEIAAGDPVYIKLLQDLMKMRTKWQNVAPDRRSVAIPFDDDAWKRWNQANWDLGSLVLEHERADVLEAVADRLGKTAIKAACLIAMSQGRDRVSLEHLLIALSYVNRWADGMITSTEMVSESFWKKDIHTLHDIILKKGGTIKWEEAYSKMDKKPGEFQQLVEGLVLSSLATVQIDPASKTRWLEAL